MKEESAKKRQRQKGKESNRARCVKDRGGNKERSVKKRRESEENERTEEE